MSFYTKAQITQMVQDALDLEEEIFITPEEMLSNINEGIRSAEAKIHTIYEDYFLTKANVALVAGTSDYTLPADMYANKIRGLVYDDGTEKYQMKRIREFKEIPDIEAQDLYKFLITNSLASGVKLSIFPASRVTNSTALTCWYLRNARQLVDDADECDIPEFVSYVVQFAKVRCMQKEGHPLLDDAEADLLAQDKLMVETLTCMIPDEDNRITMDTDIYQEMS